MFKLLHAARASISVVRRAYPRSSRLLRIKQLIRWPVLAALNSRPYLSWLDELNHADLAAAFAWQPGLALKPLRPYVSLAWGMPRRCKVIRDSYTFLAHAPHPLRRSAELRNGTLLVRIGPGHDRISSLVVGFEPRFRKEGELIISLGPINGPRRHSSVSIAFEKDGDGAWVAYLACLQGGDESQHEIREITKALHGMRPRVLLLFAAQELLRDLGVEKLYGISNRLQISRRKHLLPVPWRRIGFDYDSFWCENGGVVKPHGWYDLPLSAARRTRQDTPTRKRALYARRYELMDDVSEQIGEVTRVKPARGTPVPAHARPA